jgi:ABC-2 type transport system permease protein
MTTDTTDAASGATAEASLRQVSRDQRLHRGNQVLQLGAIVNGVIALLVIVIGAVAAANSWDLFAQGADWSLTRYDGGDDLALLLTVLLLLGNVCALLIAHISVMAQEVWGLLLVWLIGIANLLLLFWQGFIPGLVTIAAAGLAGAIITRDIGTFRTNPVMLKEIRERMRGARAFVVITVYLGLMSGFAVLMYLLQRGVIKTSITSTTGQLGRNLFEGIFIVELLLIIFITPAFTSGAISNERERKTFDLLHITLLSKAAFIVGKLESALSYVFLLLLAAVPLQSVAFLFGGVGEDELILAFVILATTSVTLGAIGLYFSTTSDRTLTASVRAYTVTAIVTVAAPAVLWFFVNMFNHAVGNTATNITHSPGVETLFIYIGALVVSLNPVLTASATQQLLVNRQEIGFWTATLSNGDKIPMIAPWVGLIIIYIMVSTAVIVLAVRRMQKADQ